LVKGVARLEGRKRDQTKFIFGFPSFFFPFPTPQIFNPGIGWRLKFPNFPKGKVLNLKVFSLKKNQFRAGGNFQQRASLNLKGALVPRR